MAEQRNFTFLVTILKNMVIGIIEIFSLSGMDTSFTKSFVSRGTAITMVKDSIYQVFI